MHKNYVKPSHPTAFVGQSNLMHFYKGSLKKPKMKEMLDANYAYSLQREYKKPRQYNHIYVYRKRQQLQLDLIDMQKLAAENDGTKYLLCVIDCFTKKAWVKCLSTKTKHETLSAIKDIFSTIGQVESVNSDHGVEFKNNLVQEYFSANNVKVYFSTSQQKSSMVERFNRSLQKLIYMYLTENQTLKYVDVLPQLVKSYNSRVHRTIAMTPNKAELDENKHLVASKLNEMYSKHLKHRKRVRKEFQVGDMVRTKYPKYPFEKGYKQQFSTELFKIESIQHRLPIATYKLRSMDTEELIEGTFYPEELTKVQNNNVFKIEKVIKRRVYRGRKQSLVKWEGFSSPKWDSWIDDKKDVTKVYRNKS